MEVVVICANFLERSSNQRRAKYLSNSITALLTRVHFFNNKVRIADDLYADHFKESKKMSTYLVAFLVSDFRHLETITDTGIKVVKIEAIGIFFCQFNHSLYR